MNISQARLEDAVRNKITKGYLAIDSKNLLLWASLTGLLISTSVVSYGAGYQQSVLDHETEIHAISTYNALEADIIRNYETSHGLSVQSSTGASRNTMPYSYIDKNGVLRPISTLDTEYKKNKYNQ